MSKLGKLGSFFKKLAQIAPAILAYTPLAPITPFIVAAAAEAEAIEGATGPEKLAHVRAIGLDVVDAINAQAGVEKVNRQEVEDAFDDTVSAVISVTKVIRD